MKFFILAIAITLGVQAPLAVSGELVEYFCGVLPKARAEQANAPDLQIRVAPLASDEPVQFPQGVSAATHMVTCARSALVPTPNDAKVLSAGYDLYVGSEGEGEEPRMALYRGSAPGIVFLILTGKQTKAERRTTEAVLKKINKALANN